MSVWTSWSVQAGAEARKRLGERESMSGLSQCKENVHMDELARAGHERAQRTSVWTLKYKNRRNNSSNIFIVLGPLKLLICFLLDIDVNNVLNYRTNYLLRKCRKKEIGNKQDCLSTLLSIVTFHEIAIKYESELKTQLVLLHISSNYNVGPLRSPHFKFCQMIYLFKAFIML